MEISSAEWRFAARSDGIHTAIQADLWLGLMEIPHITSALAAYLEMQRYKSVGVIWPSSNCGQRSAVWGESSHRWYKETNPLTPLFRTC